jgi:hypothetical protein
MDRTNDSPKPAMMALGVAIAVAAACGLALWHDYRSMPDAERVWTDAIHERLVAMPMWSFVTVEERVTGGELVPATYLVTKFEPGAAHLSGPGPGSRVFERRSRWINYANILRGPRAREHVTDVCAYGAPCWEPLANWYFLQ